MANNSPTIVAASLSDDQLKKSIDSLVTHVDEAMKKMVQSTNNAVGEMEAKLKSLGNLKIDAGGSNDGGTGRRTQQHEKLTKAVNDASEAVSKETQKLQDLQQSLSGASDREQNFISQKERAANTIAQENELLQRQEQELARLKTQQQQLADAEKNGAQSAQQQESSINRLKNKLSDLKVETRSAKAALDLLKNSRAEQLSPIAYTKNKAYDELAVANKLWDIMKRLKMDMNNGSLMTGNATEPIQKLAEYFKISREEAEKMIRALRESSVVMGKYRMSFDTRFGLYDLSMEKRSMLDKNSPYYSTKSDWELRQEKASWAYEQALRREESAERDLAQATQQSTQTSQQKAQIDAQVAAKEKEIAETKGRIATATREQSEADKSASQAAKEKANIQSQVANQEKQVAEAKKQLTTATHQQAEVEKQSVQNIAQQTAARDKQIKKNQEVSMSYDQMAAATQKATSGSKMSVIETYDMQIEMFKNRLREVRQDIDIFNAAIGSGKKTQIEWGQQGLKQANAEAEKLMRIITTLENQRGNLANVIAPQGHTIQNYVNSLQKANPELAQLNDSFKRGQSLMQNGITTTQQLANAQGELNKNTNQSKQTLDDMNAYIRQNIQREQERRDAIRQTGLAARETADQLIRSAHEQASSQGNSPITGIKELTVAVEQMRRAYFDMSASEKASPIGLALEADIKRANDAIAVIRKYNQSLLGSQQDNANKITNASTLNSLRESLKNLTEQYNRLTVAELNAGKGDALIQHFQDTTRAAQILQRTLNRPVSLKAALAGDERTLDDIAYKMQRLRAYKQGIDLTKPNAANEIKQVDEALVKLQKDADKWMSKSQEMIKNNTTLGRSWNYMKNRLAFYFTVGASTQFIKNLIEVRSQYEMNERALGILINSAERGTQIFNVLSQMALVSPYTLIELSAAAKQLTAYDIAAKDVVNTTRRLADMAAAVGIPIERLTYALGQVKAYGYLNARDARMFANAGIPLVKNLSEYYTELEGRLVSTADIYDRIKKKQIGYEEVMSTISKMTDEGGKFFDFQAKMAETLKVQLANLTLAWNNMLNAMGEETQGVLVGGISTLKQVFLHWKDIEHVLYELVVALGAYKAYQIITTRLMGATAASLDAQVLAMKRNKAAMLEKQALTRKLTVDELRQVAAQNQVTAADYRNALSGKQLTKQKALLLVALNKNNVQLKASLVNMGLLTTAEAASITRGKALAIVFKSIGISIKNAALAIKAFAASMWPLLVAGAIYELYHAWDSYGEHVKEVNKQAAEHAKEAFDNIKQYLESESTINTRQRVVYKEGNPLTDAESQKAWDEMREKIELSSSASNTFVAKLMQINDINSRLAAGFDYLRDVQRVAGVMQTLEEDAVNISSTVLGGLFGEGLKDDLTDFINTYQKYVSLNENLRQSSVGEAYFNDQKRALEEFRGEVEKTTTSLYNIASKEGFNTNEQREFFEREISEIAQAEEMGAKETRIFRMQAEKEYYAYARAQLVSQLEYQQGAQKAATEKRIKDLDNEFGANKALQESFFTWLTEKQDHAVKNMLRGKTQEEIKQGEWLKGSNAKWVEEMARKFSKEYGVSFDDLHKLVLNANTWSINIPVFFQTIGQPLSDVQRDYEARTGKKFSSNPLIKDAKTQVDILDTLKKKQKEVANEMETARKAGGKYWEDNKQRYKEENDALVADIHAYNALTDAEEKANKKGRKGGSKKDPLLDTLKQEISLVEKLQSDYDKLSKSGASQSDALDTIRGAYGKTIRLLNAQLGKYGLPQLDITQLITGKDPNKALAHFKQTLDTLVSKGMLTLERSKELEAVVEKFTLSAKTYNLDMITKGLNNELGKLKDEYELAVALDADPELGNAFASMMGIDMESLPHTVKEYADRYSTYLNKYLKGKKSSLQFTGDELIGMPRDDINALQSRVNAGTFNQEWFDAIKKAYDDIQGKRKKDIEDTEKWKNSLIEKYGNLQDKLTKIYKDSVQNQVNAVKSFGTEDQKSDIVRLQLRLEATDNPAELTEINTRIAEIVKDVTDKNPIALKVVTSSNNQTKADTSKAYWEDFKNSDIYTMTFEDMANNSTRAIELIIDKLNSLKDHVKEDPASMKALIKSLEDAEKELNARDPFGGIARSLKNMEEASKETKDAQEALWRAEVDVEQAQQEVDNAEDGTPEEQASAQQKLADAVQRRTTAQVKLTQAENKGKKAQENLKSSLQGVTGQLGNVKSLFDTVSSLFRAGGDDETADAIDAISEGFSIMTTVIMGVVAAMVLLESSQPWLLAIAAALSVIVGLVKFLSGNDNEKIDKEVKESELAVKRLENAYKDLEYQINKSYGTAKYAMERTAIANKELQLVELQRQLALEKSRNSKNRDASRIADLEGQIIDLKNQIKQAAEDITNDLLGISSVGNAAENLVTSMIEAFKAGEDYMLKFDESFENMIDNMVMKAIVGRIIGERIQELWDKVDAIAKERASNEQSSIDNLINQISDTDKEIAKYEEMQSSWWYKKGMGREEVDQNLTALRALKSLQEKALEIAQEEYEKAATPTPADIEEVRGDAKSWRGSVKEEFDAYMAAFGIKFGEKGDSKQLSLLQQGIQGITEDTAGALESYMNGVSQQVYLQSDLLTQIRDAVVGIDIDVQVATQAQMLLQLQQSYAVQMAIQGILEGWNNPSGQAVRVELVS